MSVNTLYESPSWGFESDAFYNCGAVLIHTSLVKRKLYWNQILALFKYQTTKFVHSCSINLSSRLIVTDNLGKRHNLLYCKKEILCCCRLLILKLDIVQLILKKTVS
jgi:hypothetical protein